ncbi:MAG: hypothetical protein HY909_13875 [Deltaproteobacteria bacterium]|nr:hypothetical protein [Deltaproteobacteria bacterium]
MVRVRFRRRRWCLGALCASLLALPSVVPATIEEQRARLPPPATCEDPVTGVWRSHRYNPRFGDWMIFTLTVRRAATDPASLVGSIEAHSWSGGPTQSEPPPCGPGVLHWTVEMTALGRFDAPRRQIEFWGTRWWVRERQCRGWPSYNLDHFTGTIDPRIQEFQSVNNDGGRSVNEPTVFRRVRCLEDLGAPHPAVTPPPFRPPPRRGGCS